jgi:putative ABC transport system permease protein
MLSVDSSFFTLFNFPLIQRRRGNCLSSGSIVLTKERAIALFGNTNAVDQVVSVTSADTTFHLVVSGVTDKPEENSHVGFDALISHAALPEKPNGGACYVLLTNTGSSSVLQSKINNDAQRPGLLGPGKVNYFLKPLAESYFNIDNKMGFMKTRNPMFIRIGYIVCGAILFIASFNFINLFLLFWQNRRKEIGIKKTLGITPGALLAFSFAEAGIYIFIACILSLLIATGIIPVFNSVFESNLSPAYLLNVKVVMSIGLVLFLSGALVVLTSVAKQWHMKPIGLISKYSSKVTFNRFLFTIQFVVSIILAFCAVTIIQQTNHIENAPLGFNRHMIQLNSPDPKLSQNLSGLKQKISLLPQVKNATICSGNPISGNIMARYDLPNGEYYTPYLFEGDDDFLKTLDLKILEGGPLSEKSNGKLVNQELVKHFNLKHPIGERIPGTENIISGVVENFTCSSFKQEIPPVIISHKSEGRALLIDHSGHNITRLIPLLQEEWKKVYPDHLFTYRIIQEDLIKKYKEDTFFYRIIIAFSIVSMVLSCFGLFALSWAVIQSRTKEMGIRKVLGATPVDILNLLTLTFTRRIGVAFVIAAPIGYYLMSQWLSRFANRISLHIGIFILSAVIVVTIALITLSIQTLKAALANPVDEIRSE